MFKIPARAARLPRVMKRRIGTAVNIIIRGTTTNTPRKNGDQRMQRKARPNPYRIVFSPQSAQTQCAVCASQLVAFWSNYPSLEPAFANLSVEWCISCGSGAVQGVRDFLRDFYETAYAGTNRRDREVSPKEFFQSVPSNYRDRAFNQIERLSSLGADWGSVLDYGSGPGYLLALSPGKSRFAVEPDHFSRKYLDHIGARVKPLDQFDDSCMSVIVASHSLEHLAPEDLDYVILQLKRILVPNRGLMLWEVPQGALSWLYIPHRHDPHSMFFSGEGIMRLADRHNLEIIDTYARVSRGFQKQVNSIYEPTGRTAIGASVDDGLTLVLRRAGK